MKYTSRILGVGTALLLILALCCCRMPPDEFTPESDTARVPIGTGEVTADTHGSAESNSPAGSDGSGESATDPVPGGATSGQISSDTSVSLRLLCDWMRTPGDQGEDTLTVTVKLSSYRLSVGARPGMGRLTVNGETVSFSTEAISVEDNKAATVTELWTASFRVPSGQAVSVSADWPFNGTYAGQDIGMLTCEGTVQ